MPDGLPDITKIGQAALGLPTEVLNTEMRQMSEKMNVLNAKVQELGLPAVPVPGAGAAALPPLPPLPGMGAAGTAAPPAPQPETRSAAVQGVRTTKKTSYLKV